MANTITINNVTEELYANMAQTPRELTGFLDTVTQNQDASGVTQASFGAYVKSVTTGAFAVTTTDTYTPSMTIPQAGDLTYGADSFALNKYVWASIPLMGEPERKQDNTYSAAAAFKLTMQEFWRSFRNNAESNIFSEIYKNSSRATGTAASTPFATNFNELVDARKILVDNGVASGDWYFVCDSAAGAALRKLGQLQFVNQAGTNAVQQGSLIPLSGFNLRESAAITSITKGTGTGDTITANYAAGTTSIVLSTFTEGQYLAGDVITIGSDPNKYVVVGVDVATTTLTIAKPGLRVAATSGASVTVGGSYTPNMAFSRRAIEVAYRAPLMPSGGDAAKETRVITDPASGLNIRASIYGGRGMNNLILETFMGVKVWNKHMVATVLG